jgi:hypothetical protein
VSTIAETPLGAPTTRRQRAVRIVTAAMRGGLIGGAVAAIAWLGAGLVAGTAFVVLIVASIGVAAWTVIRGNVAPVVWGVLAAAWAILALENWLRNELGGLWVAAAVWAGVILGAWRSGMPKWAVPLLAYPVALGAIVVVAGEPLDDPWGSSWLWVPAIIGPVLGLRTLLEPSRRQSD